MELLLGSTLKLHEKKRTYIIPLERFGMDDVKLSEIDDTDMGFVLQEVIEDPIYDKLRILFRNEMLYRNHSK